MHKTEGIHVPALDQGNVRVVVTAETGGSLSRDWWAMRIYELGIHACEYGFEATEAALATAVEIELDRRVDEDQENGAASSLVTALQLAAMEDRLDDLLREAQVVDVGISPIA